MQTDRIDVLTTQLAETDRRALSQAWYSALHLAERTPHAASSSVARRAVMPAPAAPRATPSRAPLPVARAGARAVAAVAGETRRLRATVGPGLERRVPKTALARRVEGVLARRPPGAFVSFVLRNGDGCVRLVVRSDGARTRVFAICAPALRERVERALAQARFALAGRGVRAELA
jgi:hypothetical protein